MLRDDAENRAPAAYADVMRVAFVLADIGLVDVVGPHGGEGADVAGHARHEAGDQRGDAEAEQPGPA